MGFFLCFFSPPSAMKAFLSRSSAALNQHCFSDSDIAGLCLAADTAWEKEGIRCKNVLPYRAALTRHIPGKYKQRAVPLEGRGLCAAEGESREEVVSCNAL